MNNIETNTGINALVSVVVPIYRVEKYLDQCITSILNQTYENLEIILVDDGTDDLSSCACDSMALMDSRIKVIHKTNGGLSDARNKGLDLMRGEYVVFIDSDDWVDDAFVQKLLEAAYAENADVVTCAHVNEYENTGRTATENRKYFAGNSEQALTLLYDQTQIDVSAVRLYKRHIWDTLRFPYAKLYEDLLTVYKVFDAADKIVQLPDGLYHYCVRDNSIMTAKFSLKVAGISDAWKENYLFCRDNYPEVAPLALSFWLEIIPGIIAQFPAHMNETERKEKKRLKKEILDNVWFIVRNMPFKKTCYIARAVCFR